MLPVNLQQRYKLDRDRMLYNFYKTFGLTDKIANIEPLGGWDEPTGLLRGHSTGHYISAMALAYASTGDAKIKENLDYVIHQLREILDIAKDLGKWVYNRLSACTSDQLTKMWDMYIAGEFGGDYDSFTCCHGTGMENHVKYQEAVYEKTDDTLYVSLYMPSDVEWAEKGAKVTQEMSFPSETSKLTVSALEGQTAQSFKMKLRVPYWATNGFTVKVNGETKIENPEISTYVEVADVKENDVIEITAPWTLHLDKTPDKIGSSEVASVMYGPFVMAAANDDGSKWYEASISNSTPKGGEFSIPAELVR